MPHVITDTMEAQLLCEGTCGEIHTPHVFADIEVLRDAVGASDSVRLMYDCTVCKHRRQYGFDNADEWAETISRLRAVA